LFCGQDRRCVVIQGMYDPALILEFDRDFHFKSLIQLL
jgi:hypothetical protein